MLGPWRLSWLLRLLWLLWLSFGVKAGGGVEVCPVMSGERVRCLRHSAEVAAPAEAVYALLADAVRRPLYSPAVVHVERMDAEGDRERLRVWELIGGAVRCSLWARVCHPGERRIEFWRLRGEGSTGSLAGQWTVRQSAGGHCVVSVAHEFTLAGTPHGGGGGEGAGDAPAAVDSARAALESVRRIAESAHGPRQLAFTFRESVRVEGPGEVVYDFLYRAAGWAGRVPHVRHVELSEPSPGIQALDYGLRLPGGTVRGASSLRLCFPHAGRIVHKQTTPWAPVAAHTGEWSVLPDEHGVRVIAEHTVLLDPGVLPDGEHAREDAEGEAGIGAVRVRVRESIGQASLAILEQARRHAESAVRALPRR